MGGGKKQKAPAAPNYAAIAAQEGAQASKIAKEITAANRPTQIDPFGNKIQWTQDAKGNWTQTATYSPQVMQQWQNMFNQSNQASGIYNNLLGQAGGQLQEGFQPSNPAEEFDPSTMSQDQLLGQFGVTGVDSGALSGGVPQFSGQMSQQFADALYGSVMDRARPEQQRQSEQLATRLRQQGLQPGTEAYDRAMRNLLTSQGDVNTLAAQNAILGGYGEARNQYASQLAGNQQAFNQLLGGEASNRANAAQAWETFAKNYQNQMLGQGQQFQQELTGYNQNIQDLLTAQGLQGAPYTPSFAGFSGATGYNPTDLLGAANASYNAKMGGYNAGQSKKGSTLGAGLGFAGSLLGGK